MVKNQQFNKNLLHWHRTDNKRSMPWKGEKEPYKIWLSEIILQQTRVEQGTQYFNAIVTKYPNICSLAEAQDDDVFSLWQGLGYYNRCRNMLYTARFVCTELKGQFPDTFESILSLKGVGEYTAAAIASFAFKLPRAVVDGNVIRIISRLYASDTNPYTSLGKRWYQEKAQELLSISYPDEYNQAIMDLGATVCTPANPQCDRCPVSAHCEAYASGHQQLYPPKKKKVTLKHRFFHFVLFETTKEIYAVKRTQKDIWNNLYTPYLIESDSDVPPPEMDHLGLQQIHTMQQSLSHQRIHFHFYRHPSGKLLPHTYEQLVAIPKKSISSHAFPRSILVLFKKIAYL